MSYSNGFRNQNCVSKWDLSIISRQIPALPVTSMLACKYVMDEIEFIMIEAQLRHILNLMKVTDIVRGVKGFDNTCKYAFATAF